MEQGERSKVIVEKAELKGKAVKRKSPSLHLSIRRGFLTVDHAYFDPRKHFCKLKPALKGLTNLTPSIATPSPKSSLSTTGIWFRCANAPICAESCFCPRHTGHRRLRNTVLIFVGLPFHFSRSEALAYIITFQIVNYAVLIVWGGIGLWRLSSKESARL